MPGTWKSSILIAHTIAWSGAVLCSLIATYGPHGPARHPKMLLICLLPLAVLSLVSLRAKGGSGQLMVANGVLWGVAFLTAFAMANTSLGTGIPPLATTVVLVVVGAIALGVLACSACADTRAERNTTDA